MSGFKYKQISVPITLGPGPADQKFLDALAKAEAQAELDMTHDLETGLGEKKHDPACAICARRREAAKYCHECGRPYEEESNE